MEKIVEQNLLYDFYGELLTEHQQRVYQDAVFNDMSLSEVADCYGITRQGAHDLLKRCDRLMQGYEDKLHLIARFTSAKTKLFELKSLAEAGKLQTKQDQNRIFRLIEEIIEEL